jgi:hypothetical protein
MTIEARIHMPTDPSSQRWRHLMALAEVLTEANAEWFGAQLDHADMLRAQGRIATDPPCCIACVEPKIRYCPPPPGDQQRCQNWWSAPQVIARGKATCLDAAAFDAGAARAKGKQAYVDLEPVGRPLVPGDPYSTLDFHAVAIIDGERVDSTLKLAAGNGCAR